MPTSSNTCLTSISIENNLAVCGFGDGIIRLFDDRENSNKINISSTLKEHKTWVVHTHIHPGIIIYYIITCTNYYYLKILLC